MEGPDVAEVSDKFPGRELVAVAGEVAELELDVELVGLEEEMLVPGPVASLSTTRTRSMNASHFCTVIQAPIVARRRRGDNHIRIMYGRVQRNLFSSSNSQR